MKKNIAVVGCGQWGKNLIRNFFELGVLFSICDSNVEVANMYAKQYGVKNSSFNEILNDTKVKGVVLSVPAYLHALMATKLMKAGKHVFVEKPLALKESDAKLMIQTAKKNKVQLMVGHLLQYHPIFKTIKNICNAGEIGELNYIYSNRLSFGKVRTKEDIIWSFAPHDVSMILSLACQNPEFITARSTCIIQKNLADIATIFLEFKSGLKSSINVSWLNPFKDVRLVVSGKTAVLIFDDTKPWDKKLALYSYGVKYSKKLINLEKSVVKYLKVPEEEPLKIECQHFVNVIKKKIKPLTDGIEGLRVLKILHAASISHKKNTRIKIKDYEQAE